MQVTPRPGQVYVERVDPSKSAIIRLDAPEGISGGKVVAVADHRPVATDCCPDCCPSFTEGMDQAPMDATLGQYVLFKPRSADVFSIAGRTFFNVHEDNLLLSVDTLEEFQQLTPAIV